MQRNLSGYFIPKHNQTNISLSHIVVPVNQKLKKYEAGLEKPMRTSGMYACLARQATRKVNPFEIFFGKQNSKADDHPICYLLCEHVCLSVLPCASRFLSSACCTLCEYVSAIYLPASPCKHVWLSVYLAQHIWYFGCLSHLARAPSVMLPAKPCTMMSW